MQNSNKRAAQKPLILKNWTYKPDGKPIKELIEISFLEFYFASKIPSKAPEHHQNAC